MKYVVDVNGERHIVELDGEQAVVGDEELNVRMEEVEGTPVRLVRIGDALHRVIVRRGSERGAWTLWIDGFRHELNAMDERRRAIEDIAAAAGGTRGPAPLVAPMPGMIVRVNVAVGDEVKEGQGLVVMEAMKMENELRAPSAGVVEAVMAEAGQAVERGAVLVQLSKGQTP